MDIGPSTDAALLQRALDGGPVPDADIRALVAVADAVRGLDRAGLAPSAGYVASLRERLLDDAAEIAIGGLPEQTDDPRRAMVLRMPHRALKLATAVAASVLIVAALVGLASRSAMPGDVLYPVKQLLDRAAVALSGSRLDEGRTHLAQAQQHVSEARDLLDRGDVDPDDPGDLVVALDAASDSVIAADSVLTDVYLTQDRPEAITELADFLTRARPQVDAMDTRIPDASRPAYERLRTLLAQAEVEALRRVAACAECAAAATRAQAALVTLDPAATPMRTSPPTGPTARPGVTLPGATVAVPSVGVTTDGAAVDGGGVTLPGATLDLPSVGLTTGGAAVDGGGVTLPGAELSLPRASLSVGTVDPSALPTLTSPLLAPEVGGLP
jgi:hypothetical protein